ncbi:formate dehydrogenase accessory protein FdhE [Nonomuraea sp. NPDC050404]|uniref:formate dehydrogenase accessory protein FdhE domain-containing protein n=1 Tax=Nonomuraea sp. NPDC050404 TaxID=3155783 RepID=UPI0033C3F516
MYGRERARALELRERYPHAREVLGLYLALAEVWESAAHQDAPPLEWAKVTGRSEAVEWVNAAGRSEAVEWAGAKVLPRVMAVTAAAGPRPLAEAMGGAVLNGGAEPLLAAWLADEELTPVERYLARATLHALAPRPRHTDATPSGGVAPHPRGEAAGRCPVCGGPPQLSYRTASDDPLVSGRRMLACAKCPNDWSFSATTCPNCGESGKRTVHAEQQPGPHVGRPTPDGDGFFPHLRAESCQTCRRYLIDIDLGRDPAAVPRVDELVAIPLDLHLAGQGQTKITPNLMGF